MDKAFEGYYHCCITYQISITKMSGQGHWVKDCFVFEFTIQPLVPTYIENLYIIYVITLKFEKFQG